MTGGEWRVGDHHSHFPAPGNLESASTARAIPGEVQVVSGTVRPSAPGLYQFATADGQNRIYAVNLKAEESDPRGLWADTEGFSGAR